MLCSLLQTQLHDLSLNAFRDLVPELSGIPRSGVHFSFGGKKWKNRANYGKEAVDAENSGKGKSRIQRKFTYLQNTHPQIEILPYLADHLTFSLIMVYCMYIKYT
jgi:hypothetical protein